MNEPDYRGISALVIAASGAFGIFVIVPIAVLMGRGLGEIGSDVIIALGGVLVGSLATYMGMHAKTLLPSPQASQKSAHTKDKANEPDTN